MPSGYTADITDTMPFRDFAMKCARAFGATIMMRDDPLDAPITRFEPSDYHKKNLDESKSNLAALELLSDDEAAEISKREYDKRQKDMAKAIADVAGKEVAYRRMLSLVRAWTPPTPDHVRMKEFMIEQINESIKVDCGTEYYEKAAAEPLMTGKEWKEHRLETLLRDVEYHAKNYREEVDRTNERNKWVDDLRRSLE